MEAPSMTTDAIAPLRCLTMTLSSSATALRAARIRQSASISLAKLSWNAPNPLVWHCRPVFLCFLDDHGLRSLLSAEQTESCKVISTVSSC